MHDHESLLVSEHAFDWPAEPLAEGGMALVYEARDRRLPRSVILKSPRIERRGGGVLTDEERAAFVERLQAEADVLAKLQHPSIVTIHEVGRGGDGRPFCVLEKVQGRSLTDVLEELSTAEIDGRPRTLERIQLVSNLVAIAEALACAHENGIVHRDVNPNNILVGPHGEMTLIDWGIASDTRSAKNLTVAIDRAVDGVASDALFVTIGAGTPPYMSLEQTQGVAARPSFDIYSFGATLYHVVAGKPPFEYGSLEEFLEIIASRTTPPPASFDDRDLSAIIALAMAPDPEMRPTAGELIENLRAYLTGELVFAQRYSWTGRVSRWIRQQPVAAGAIALAVVAAVVAVLVWNVSEQRAQRVAREAAEVKALAESRAAAAQRDATEKARAQAEAERQRADAVVERQRAEEVAKAKEAEAEAALAEANAARGDRERYKVLKERADAAAGAANDARRTADQGLRAAEEVARNAAARASESAAEAQRSQATADAAARERDAAIAGRNDAERARAAAEQARLAAEQARDDAIAGRDDADRDLAEARDRIAELERELEAARRRPPAEPSPEPEPAAPTP